MVAAKASVKRKVVTWDAARVKEDYRIAMISRMVSLVGRKEVLSGKAKFGIFGDGKEVAQIAMARAFEKGDWRSGYYRDQTFMLALGAISVRQYFAQLYADSDVEHEPHSRGRQMNAHFASRFIDDDGVWRNQLDLYNSIADASPTACQMARLLGLGYASKLYRASKDLSARTKGFSRNGNEVAFGTIGNASTSEGVFWETLNATGVLQLPIVVSVWDDEYGISVPNKYQTTKESISQVCQGFQRSQTQPGVEIYQVKGWDYAELMSVYQKAATAARKKHIPALVHVIEMTQPQGHSTSGSHERYKPKERLQFEKSMDCLTKMKDWILSQGLAKESELCDIEAEAEQMVHAEQAGAWADYQQPIEAERQQLIEVFSEVGGVLADGNLEQEIQTLQRLPVVNRKNILSLGRKVLYRLRHQGYDMMVLSRFLGAAIEENQKRYDQFLHNESAASVTLVEPVAAEYPDSCEKIDGRLVINRCFENLLARDERIFVIGEDIGKLGGVNLEFDGLNEKFGENRVTDTGIREASILGQAIGAAARGLRPVADIQYLDYLLYALQVMSDDLATLHYRSGGGQLSPVIVRTKGHRLEGIWHTGSPMGMIINALRGMYVCVPRNMVQAAGMYNTLFAGDDSALVVEVLNGYRLKEIVPSNLDTFKIPLGQPEVICTGDDITLVTYGCCVGLAEQVLPLWQQVGISVEIIDVRTLLPFDVGGMIVNSLRKTHALLVLDEDVPGGASAYILQQVIDRDGGFDELELPAKTLTAKDHRSPYGSDGDYFSKPSCEDIFEGVYDMMRQRQPQRFQQLYE